MPRLVWAAVLLVPTIALASRYDPDADRAALRQAATLSYSMIVDSTGLALEPAKVPAISAGLDEGRRLANLAAATAGSLVTAAKARSAEIESVAKGLDRAIREASEPVAAERLRLKRLASGHADLMKKFDALADTDKKAAKPLLEKASGALRAGDEGLRPLEGSVKIMGERALEMESARSGVKWLLVEISSVTDATIRRAEDLPAPMAEAKVRLSALPDRTRVWDTLDLLRGIASRLLDAADRACNRADEFRRLSADFDKASGVFATARSAAAAGLAGSKSLINDAQGAQDRARERVEKPN